MITKICETCGKEFKVKPYRKDTARFCSSVCWTQSKESKTIVSQTQKKRHKENPMNGDKNTNWKGGYKQYTTCLNCGSRFLKRNDSLSIRDFCSIQCVQSFCKQHPFCGVGKDNVNWKGGHIPRCIKKEWRNLRKVILERDNNRCVYCGSKKHLVIHHIVSVREGGKDVPENLETVCNVCHPTVESGWMVLYIKAISDKCKQCMDGNNGICDRLDCPMYRYNPHRIVKKRNLTDEQRKELSVRFKNIKKEGK